MDIGDSFQNTTDGIFDFLPNLLGFLVILLIGFIVAKVVSGVVRKLLEKVHVDKDVVAGTKEPVRVYANREQKDDAAA